MFFFVEMYYLINFHEEQINLIIIFKVYVVIDLEK